MQALFHKLYNKIKRVSGASVGEMLTAVLILLLASGVLVAVVSLGSKNFKNTITRSESNTLYSTSMAALTNELEFASEVHTDESGNVTKLIVNHEQDESAYSVLAPTDAYGQLSFNTVGDGTAQSRELLSRSAYPNGLKVKVNKFTFTNKEDQKYFTVELSIQDSKNNDIETQSFDVLLANDQKINVVVEDEEGNPKTASYTVQYVTEDGTEVAESETLTGNVGSQTNAQPKNVTGYSYKTINQKQIQSDGSTVVKVIYVGNTLQVTWQNYNGDILKVNNSVAYGETVHYDGETPTRPSEGGTTYTFTGWTPEEGAVTESTVYTAKFDKTETTVNITFDAGDGHFSDGSKTKVVSAAIGDMPSVPGEPVKDSTDTKNYTFAGWTPEITEASGATTYTAQYTETVRTYPITWKNWDGTEIKTDNLAYGTMPKYEGTTPEKAADAKFTYAFTGWTPVIKNVIGAAEYTAEFSQTLNKYTVTWADEDGTPLETDEVEYGDMPVYKGDTPVKAGDAQYTYTFKEWSPEIVAVTGHVTYTAVYDRTVNKNTVTWANYDGKTLHTDTVEYGQTPSYTGDTPTRAADAQYTYTFDGWTPAIDTVKGNVTYTAKYATTVNTYTVTWYDEDGKKVLEKDENVPYDSMPKYDGDTPTKATTAEYSYTFAGWSPAVVSVTGDASYKATYTETANEYTVSYEFTGSVVPDGVTVPAETKHAYNTAVSMETMAAVEGYTFSGWTTTDATVSDGSFTMPAQNVKFTGSWTKNKYTVTWKNDDGKVLKTEEVEYGTTPAYGKADPTKASTDQYTYAFAGWTPTVVAVTGNATYKATYTETANEYTVSYEFTGSVIPDGVTVPAETKHAYNTAVSVETMAAVEGYTFSRWTTTDATVSDGSFTMPARNVKFTGSWTKNKYTVTWKNDDGKVLKTEEVEYGTTPKYSGTTPTKASTAECTYTFKGWSPEIVAVTGNVTYTASYTETANEYTVSYEFTGSVIPEGVSAPAATKHAWNTNVGVETMAAVEGYTFSGWTTTDVTVSDGSFTMPAQNVKFTGSWTKNKYTVTWKNDDGKVLKTEEVEYGKTPSYDGTPTKASTAEYTYTFKEWSPEIVAVTGNVTYTATYNSTRNSYTVTWMNDNGKVLGTDKVEYGTKPQYTGTTPTKAATAECTYTFKGWTPAIDPDTTIVTGDVTYTASYTETSNEYTVSYEFTGSIVPEGVSAPAATKHAWNTNVGVETMAAVEGYTFSGWTTTDVTVSDGSFTMPARNVKFTGSWTKIKYTVTWVDEDGKTVLKSEEVEYGATPDYGKADPTKASTDQYTYAFAGWTPTVVAVTGNATYKAIYTETANEYTVSYEFTGSVIPDGVTVPAETKHAYNTAVSVETMAAVEGYTFSGWTTTDATVSDGSFTMPARNVKFTGSWTKNKYTVTWVDEDGKTVLKSEEVEYGATPKYDGTPTKAETEEATYTFKGWNPVESVVTGDITYTATYNETKKFKVTFDAQGGTMPSGFTNPQKVVSGGTVSEPSAAPTKSGYEFEGWYTDQTFLQKYDFSTVVLGDKTLYAKWVKTYTITLYQNKDVGQKEDADTTNKKITVTEGTEYVLPDKTTLSFENGDKYISKWKGTDGEYHSVGSTITVNKNIILYAIWDANTYTLSFDKNRGSGDDMSSITQVSGTTTTLPACTFTAPSGKIFVGWYDQDTSTLLQPGDAWTFKSDKTLYAIWHDAVQLTFHANDGSSKNVTKQVEKGKEMQIPSAAELGFVKGGYDLVKWTGNDDGSGDSYSAGASYTPSGSADFYAQWGAHDYTISFAAGDHGQGSMGSVPVAYGSSYTVPENSFTGEDTGNGVYQFVSWSGSDGNTYAPGSTLTVNGNVTLTAQWKLVYTVTFVNDDGTFVRYADAGKTIDNWPDDPTKEGYKFKGWQTSSGISVTSSTIINGNMTVTAQWSKTYKVTYHEGYYSWSLIFWSGTQSISEETIVQEYEKGTIIKAASSFWGSSINIWWNGDKTFKYWTSGTKGSGTKYYANTTSITVNSDIDVYGWWA